MTDIEMMHVRALKDNYIWIIVNSTSGRTIVIDPGEARPVIQYLQTHKLELAAVLITHHHWDHTAGVPELIAEFNPIIYRSPFDDNQICIEGFPQFEVLSIPGHTLDHVAFYFPHKVFCGDTLFSAGCGRLFEGSPREMYSSLQKIAALPEHTEIYCGHEYTLNNLKFAEKVEPGNLSIKKAILDTEMKIISGQPSLPSNLRLEKAINPFLRCEQKEVIRQAEAVAGRTLLDAVEVFSVLREWKNQAG